MRIDMVSRFGLALGIALAFGQASAQTCSPELAWTAPTENVDGTMLADLAGFRVYWGPAADDLPNTAQIDDPVATMHTVADLADGTWFFAATAFNAADPPLESDFSNIASTTCVTLPDPRPPADVSVSIIVAYQYLPQVDRAVMLPVGEVPEGTLCDGAEIIVAAGVVHYGVPRDTVAWYGTVQPDAVYAECN